MVTLETELQNMVDKTKEALDLLKAINPNYLAAQHMRSANTKSAEWHELDRKSKIEPIMPPKLMIELKEVLQNESNVLLSALILGLGNGYWIEYMKVRHEEDGISISQIARELNTCEVPAKRGGNWFHKQVSRILNYHN